MLAVGANALQIGVHAPAAIESGSNMAGASLPSFAVSPASRQLWEQFSLAQQRTVRALRESLCTGSPARLSKWHQLGRLAQTLSSNHKETYGQNTLDALAEMVDSTSQVVGKARKFARLYTAAESVDLEGTATWEQMRPVVVVNDARIRRNLLNACRSKNWSLRELEHEIRRQVGRQRSFGRGGRPSRRPESLQDAMADFDRLATAIVRWYHALEPEVAADSERSSQRSASQQLFDLDQIPPPLRRRISDAVQSLEEARAVVQGALEIGVSQTPTRPRRRRR